MSTLHRSGDSFIAYTKGAPELVLDLCTSQWRVDGAVPLQHEAILASAEAMAAQGLRVLALARRTHATLPTPGAVEAVESELSLLGLIGLIDPPLRPAPVPRAEHGCCSQSRIDSRADDGLTADYSC